jgi:hypothetical protein
LPCLLLNSIPSLDSPMDFSTKLIGSCHHTFVVFPAGDRALCSLFCLTVPVPPMPMADLFSNSGKLVKRLSKKTELPGGMSTIILSKPASLCVSFSFSPCISNSSPSSSSCNTIVVIWGNFVAMNCFFSHSQSF